MIKAKIKAKLAHYPKKFLSQLKSYFTNELNTKLDSLIMIHAQTLSLQHLEHYKQRVTGGGAE
ncbi:hypothetical protein [Helicobacter marmotae]|uniref:hypothetical protein n=1 Tax=Helicobacter marmotae TaxID=152490 RepID=UPI001FD1F10B|nr:hypothetical protein [Helicobacter marmotae]